MSDVLRQFHNETNQASRINSQASESNEGSEGNEEKEAEDGHEHVNQRQLYHSLNNDGLLLYYKYVPIDDPEV